MIPENVTENFHRKHLPDLSILLAKRKSRRNKKFVSGNSLYNSYVSEQCKNIPALQKLLALASDNEIDLDIATIQLLVADCALHLFLSKNNIQIKERNNILLQFL